MRLTQIPFIVIGGVLPAFLVLGQENLVDTFERNFRPHVTRQGIVSGEAIALPPKTAFHIDRIEYATWIIGNAIESSPDWTPTQPAPLGFAQLEEIARRELAKILTNDAPWSVTSFQLLSTPGRQRLKWYFLVEMKPVWEPTL